MDPDYELPEGVREEASKRREKEKQDQVEKVRIKIHEEFQKELGQREEQLIEIQNHITCLAKTLHVLRYVLVSSYYNKPEAQLQLSEEELKLVDKQQRLHPAVKRLTSERELANLDFSKRKTRRTQKPAPNHVMSIDMNGEVKEPKAPDLSTSVVAAEESDDSGAMPRNRQMAKRKIIVGNISKWMPSDNPEDNSTHKWMVYIRGPAENPRIDDIVERVVFHLHPSYQPHDVVEVSEHPFHLTRRGWGEFPMRCKLIFNSPLNKPVDVIHHLKLDKTYSGRQTLGNESVIELTLYDENAVLTENNTHQSSSDLLSDMHQSISSDSQQPPQQIAKQLVVNDYSHSKTIKDEILDPSYMDVENIDILETGSGLMADGIKSESTDTYYEHCPALSDHTYSMRSVRSC